VGELFRFPRYDDPWRGSRFEGTFWKKVTTSVYINMKKLGLRPRIDDPNRNVYEEKDKSAF
jgi:hypothetical protein